VDGVADPAVERLVQEPTVSIEVSLAKAQRYDIKPGDVRRRAATLLNGIQVGSLFDKQKVFEVVVRATPDDRRSLSDIRNLLVDTPDGGHVRLGQIADVRIRPTPQVIQRDASSRRIDVTADVRGRSLGDVQRDVEARLQRTHFPLEYHAQVIDDATGRQAGWPRLLAFGLAAAIGVLLLLQAAFRRWRLAAVTLLSLPVALVGGEVAGVIAGGAFSLGALTGLLVVLAIAVRGGIALIAHLDQLQERREESFGAGLVRRGAQDRLGPVLVSAIACAVALLPFVVLGDRAGLELVQPMAVVVLGGLVTSALVTLFVVPALYVRFGSGYQPDLTDGLELVQMRAGGDGSNGNKPPPEPVGAAADPVQGR
jgi:Cu/Ag efflux pump CusA